MMLFLVTAAAIWLLGAIVIFALRAFGLAPVETWYGLPRVAGIFWLVVLGLSLVGAALLASARQTAWASRLVGVATFAAASVTGFWAAGLTVDAISWLGIAKLLAPQQQPEPKK